MILSTMPTDPADYQLVCVILMLLYCSLNVSNTFSMILNCLSIHIRPWERLYTHISQITKKSSKIMKKSHKIVYTHDSVDNA